MTFGITAASIGSALVGAAATGVVGKVLGGGGGSGGGGGGSVESPTTTLNNIKSLTNKSNNAPPKTSETKAAASAKIPGLLDDPWQHTKEWYKDLGGEGDPDFEGAMP